MTTDTCVVIFASSRSDDDQDGYAAMAMQMERLAQAQPDFIEMPRHRAAVRKSKMILGLPSDDRARGAQLR
jgi:hypothetical protein